MFTEAEADMMARVWVLGPTTARTCSASTIRWTSPSRSKGINFTVMGSPSRRATRVGSTRTTSRHRAVHDGHEAALWLDHVSEIDVQAVEGADLSDVSKLDSRPCCVSVIDWSRARR